MANSMARLNDRLYRVKIGANILKLAVAGARIDPEEKTALTELASEIAEEVAILFEETAGKTEAAKSAGGLQ